MLHSLNGPRSPIFNSSKSRPRPILTSISQNSAIDGASNVLGVTGFSFSGGQLQNADIEFDSADNLSGSEFSLVAIHEIGHAIGLGHFNDDPAVMNSTANFALTVWRNPTSTALWRFMAPTPPIWRMRARGPRRRTPPLPDGTGDTGTTPDTPTADADNDGAGGCGGTQTAAGDGATGTGADAGIGDGGAPFAFGDLGGRFADLASLLNSMQGDNSDAAAGSGAGLDGAQLADLSNFVHQHFDNHLWG